MNWLKNGIILSVLLALPFAIGSQYYLHLVIMAGIFTILALSLNLLLGYTGQLSLGHAAFFGIGAYTSALLDLKLGVSFFGGLLAAAVMAGLAGYFIGKVSFKLRGAYFVLVTISFAEVSRLVSLNWMDLTSGPLGLPGIAPPRFTIPGLVSFTFSSKISFYYLLLGIALVVFYVMYRLVHSRIGRAFIALRENENLAESVGISGYRYLVISAVISGASAGMAGSLYAHYVTFISPEVFAFGYTVTMVIMVIAGGKGTLLGPIIGSIIFTLLPEMLRATAAFRFSIYGIVMIVIIIFMPLGIVPYMRRIPLSLGRGAAA